MTREEAINIIEDVTWQNNGRHVTNADRIRAMSDEELARWLTNFFWGNKPAKLFDLLKWLQQPAKEDA